MTRVVRLSELEASPHANVFPEAEPKTVLLSLEAGERVASHTHPGRDVVLHLLDGAVELNLDDETRALESGDVVRFEGEREISPAATEPSTALILLARRTDE